jgi:hypothetical protein
MRVARTIEYDAARNQLVPPVLSDRTSFAAVSGVLFTRTSRCWSMVSVDFPAS